MFKETTYLERRKTLRKQAPSGILLFLGNGQGRRVAVRAALDANLDQLLSLEVHGVHCLGLGIGFRSPAISTAARG